MRLHVCLCSLILVMCSTGAFAQTPTPIVAEPGLITVTPFVGAGFGGDLESSPVAFGAALGYGLSPKFAVEGDLYFEPDAEQGQLIAFDSSIWGMSANLLYHFTGEGESVTPYVAAGLGFVNTDAELEDTLLVDDDTSTKFAWNWGGGIKSSLNDRYGLRADIRYFTGDELAPDHWRLYGGLMIHMGR